MVTPQDIFPSQIYSNSESACRLCDKLFLQYPLTNSSISSPYISLKKQLRDFVKRSKYFSLVIILFSNSHNLLPSLCVEIIGRELSCNRGIFHRVATGYPEGRRLNQPPRVVYSRKAFHAEAWRISATSFLLGKENWKSICGPSPFPSNKIRSEAQLFLSLTKNQTKTL